MEAGVELQVRVCVPVRDARLFICPVRDLVCRIGMEASRKKMNLDETNGACVPVLPQHTDTCLAQH